MWSNNPLLVLRYILRGFYNKKVQQINKSIYCKHLDTSCAVKRMEFRQTYKINMLPQRMSKC